MASLSRRALILAAGSASQSILTQVGVNLILVRIFSSQELFGIYRQVWLVVNTAIPLFTFGTDLSLYYFWSRLPHSERRTFLLRSLIILGISGLLLAAGLYAFAEPLARAVSVPEAAELFRAICPYVLIGLPVTLFYNFLVADNRPVRAAVTNLIVLLLQAVLTVSLIAAGGSLKTLFHLLGIYIVARAVYAVSEILRFTSGSVWTHVSVPLRTQLQYAIPTGITTQITMIGSRVDKFVVAGFLDPAAYAMYSIGAIEFPLIGLLWASATTVMRIRIAELHHAGEPAPIHRFYLAAFRKLSLSLVPAAVALSLFARELMVVLYTSEYGPAAGIFRIYLLLTLFKLMPFDAVLASIGRTRVVFLGGGMFLILDILLCLVMVQPMGLIGPPWATVLAAGAMSLYYGIITARALGVPFRSVCYVPGLERIVASAAVAGLIAYPIKLLALSPAVTLLAGGVVYAGAYLTLSFAIRAMTRDDVAAVIGGLARRGTRKLE